MPFPQICIVESGNGGARLRRGIHSLRRKLLYDRLRIPCPPAGPFDAHDAQPHTLHALACVGEQPIATMRLCLSSANDNGGTLPIQQSYDLAPLFEHSRGQRIGQVGLLCIDKAWRASMFGYAPIVALAKRSLELGVELWLATADIDTRDTRRAWAIWTRAERKRPWHGPRMRPRRPATMPSRTSAVTPMLRRWPTTLATYFRLGARVAGPPQRDPLFRNFELPIAVSPADILHKLDRLSSRRAA